MGRDVVRRGDRQSKRTHRVKNKALMDGEGKEGSEREGGIEEKERFFASCLARHRYKAGWVETIKRKGSANVTCTGRRKVKEMKPFFNYTL